MICSMKLLRRTSLLSVSTHSLLSTEGVLAVVAVTP
jgi:hypothetical protein